MHVQVGSERPGNESAGVAGALDVRVPELHAVERPREFETQHKLLLLETLYDAGLALGALPDENALVEDVLGRAVGVLDAARGYLATFGESGERRAEARVGFPRRLPDAAVAEDEFLVEVARSQAPVREEQARLLRTGVWSALGVAIRAGGRTVGVLVLADKEIRRGGRAPFDEEDARFLSSLAGLSGMAIENRRHLQRLTRERERLEEENRRLLDATGRFAAGRVFIGESPAVRRVLDLVGRVAPSRTSVLITGESGTGKELVARMIHARSDRADKPFVAINCAALPETLLESELFGIERGVATGVEARTGRLESANGGTLFLDEIGDMPVSVQAKLLRVLQEREIERVGGRQGISIDLRVLAATNAPLTDRIASGQFREDLYYRLRVVEIALPPLRERREDIPKLARHFLERFSAREGREPLVLDREAFAALLTHDFAGNIRELENLLEGAATLSRGNLIRIEDLQWLPGRALGLSSGPDAGAEDVASLRLLEERHIRRVLKLAGGNKSRAARMLGISRRTLYRKKHLDA
jgi:transcriptional regulator with GAF, ATPase, and Fis domain